MAENFANDKQTTLSGAINNSQTSITVASSTGFPAVNFRVKIDSEILKVTNVSGTTWTVERGAEGTTAASHSNNATVDHVLSRDGLLALRSDIFIADTLANRPSAGLNGRLFEATDIDLVYRDDGTNWNLWKPIRVPFAERMVTASWTQVNFGTATQTEHSGTFHVSYPTGTGDNIRLLTKTLPSAPYTVIAVGAIFNVSIDFNLLGFGVREASSDKMTIIAFGATSKIRVDNYTSKTVFLSNLHNQTWPPITGARPVWLKIIDDNTNRTYHVSFNGKDYIQLASHSRTANGTPDQVILTGNVTSTAGGVNCSGMWYQYKEG